MRAAVEGAAMIRPEDEFVGDDLGRVLERVRECLQEGREAASEVRRLRARVAALEGELALEKAKLALVRAGGGVRRVYA